MKKVKLLFVISNIDIGGPQKSLLALLDNIDYSIFDVTVLVLKPGGSLKKHYNKNVHFVDTQKIVIAATIPSENTFKHLKVFIKNREITMLFDAIFSIFKYTVLKKNMNQERQKFWKKHHNKLPQIAGSYDIAFGILGLSTYAVVDLVDAKSKFHWVRSDTRILNRNIEIDAEYYNKLNGALSVSKETAIIFENMYPFMKGKVNVFYNHIPISFYNKIEYDKSLMSTNKKTYKILTITRLDPLKGIELAIDACEILVKKGYNIRWFVLGGGKYKNEVLKMIKEKGLEETFILLGFQLNTLGFIEDADIFVHPSRTEGKSNAVDEAKFIGKPIVVTNYDTVEEQIQNEVNGLIAAMDGFEIAKSIEKIIDDNTLRDRLISNCINNTDASAETTEYFLGLLNDRRKQ